jgi:hypothetical protein
LLEVRGGGFIKVQWNRITVDDVEARHDTGEILPFDSESSGGFVEFSTLICFYNSFQYGLA